MAVDPRAAGWLREMKAGATLTAIADREGVSASWVGTIMRRSPAYLRWAATSGRPGHQPDRSPEFIERARKMWDGGLTYSAIAAALGVTKGVIAGLANRHDFAPRRATQRPCSVLTPKGRFLSLHEAAEAFGMTRQVVWDNCNRTKHGWSFIERKAG